MLLCLRSLCKLFILSGTLAASAGCSELFDPPDDSEGDTLRLRTLWFQPQTGYARPQPAISGDVVYTAAGDGRVIARDLATGVRRWTTTVGTGSLEGSNLVASAGVVVAPVVYHTVGLDAATGRELWRYEAPIDSVGGGPPNPGTVARVRVAADDEAVYLSAWGGSVASVGLRTGTVRWTWTPPPDTPFRFGGEGVTLDDGIVYAVSAHALDFYGSHCEMWVVALEARTGRQIWLAKIPAKGTISCTAGRPAVTKDRVIAMQMTGELFGLDRRTGEVVWNVPPDTSAYLAVLSSPEVYDDVVYAATGDDHLRAFRAEDGQPLWRTPVRAQFANDLLVTEDNIYGVDGPYLFAFDRRTGRLLGQTRQPREPELGGLFRATPAYVDGRIIAPVNDGVWAFKEP